MKRWHISLLLLVLLGGCQETRPTKPTLRQLDQVGESTEQQQNYIKPKSDEEIRKAYLNYLKDAAKNNADRVNALNRLAEIELELTEKLNSESGSAGSGSEADSDQAYDQRLNKTIELLETSYREYPDAKNNDRILYQLAKAYDQSGRHEESIKALKKLVAKYKKSPFYVESMFRIAEDDFSRRDYLGAEQAYTTVLESRNNSVFYEKSLFKRGWSRFKQQYYTEAVDDFLQAVYNHNFPTYDKLSTSEKETFDEYFRAIGLAFTYINDPQQLAAYFIDTPNSPYIYRTYSVISDILEQQQRYTDAVNILKQFVKQYPDNKHAVFAQLKILDIWKTSGFQNKILAAIDKFYRQYNPDSKEWKNAANPDIRKQVASRLKDYILLVAAYYHKEYQGQHKPGDFQQAQVWYERYLKHYSHFAQKDNIYNLYAELLLEHKQTKQALKYYELAAFDGDIIINKEAAYTSILLSDKLGKGTHKDNTKYRDRQFKYSRLFSEQYPQDKRTASVVVHAADMAYEHKDYKAAIQLCANMPLNSQPDLYLRSSQISANSHLKLGEYGVAENQYKDILKSPQLIDRQARRNLENSLGLAIYRQAAHNKEQNQVAQAIQDYARVADTVPDSDIAPTALYDGIALCMASKLWKASIPLIKQFQSRYPHNKQYADVTRKLSIAYLNSNQNLEAAKEFEKVSSLENNVDLKKAALWQAAELYESKDDLPSAIRSYKSYATQYPNPVDQNLEAMFKLTVLYTKAKQDKNADHWRMKILQRDRQIPSSKKNDRSKFIASSSALGLAHHKMALYESIQLVQPLKRNLRNKKKAMQQAVKYYGQAAAYGLFDIATEATYSIGRIYRDFSKSLLKSERPSNLSPEEKEQYNILLEDQAFPFEDKAIEFHEINMARIIKGFYNDWIIKSHEQLKQLFPVRYNRKPKVDAYVQYFK